MKKRVLSVLLAIVMVVGLFPVTAGALPASSHEHPVCGATHSDIGDHTGTCEDIPWTAWDGGSISSSGKYYLSSSPESAASIKIGTEDEAIEVKLCLNGQTLSVTRIEIINATVDLCDCSDEGSGKIKGTETNYTVYQYGTYQTEFNMYGGTISGISSGGAVNVDGYEADHTFNMYGGTVTNAYSSNTQTGAVYVCGAGGKFNMYGGTIKDCTGTCSGVYADGGATVTMAGGTIKNNNAGTFSGGVYLSGWSGAIPTFNMTGGSITDNQGSNGGGVYIIYGTFNMSGTAAISNNQSANGGGGVHMYHSNFTSVVNTFNMTGGSITNNTGLTGGGVDMGGGSASAFTMTGGTISDNKATGSGGGGMYLRKGTLSVSGTAAISDNTAENGGGVYLNGGTFDMSGTAAISGNTVSENGGGVYVHNGTFTVSGSPVITGNTKSGNANNVYLTSDNTITVNGELTGGNNSIGVNMADPGVFAQPDGDNVTNLAGYVNFFTSDDANYKPAVDDEDDTKLSLVSALVAVTGVELDKESVTLGVGGSETLTATVAPNNATNTAVTWGSDNEAVATVNNGFVRAVGAGTATITVTTEDGGFTDTCTVTVNKIAITGTIVVTTVTEPKVGETYTPNVNVSNELTTGHYSMSASSFSPSASSDPIKAGTVYTLSLTFQPYSGYFFDENIQATFNGEPIDITRIDINGTIYLQLEYTYSFPGSMPNSVDILQDEIPVTTVPIVLPGVEQNDVVLPFTTKVLDQYGQEMTGQTIEWSITGTNTTGISVNNGTVTVSKDAAVGNYTLTATCGGKSDSITIQVEKAASVLTTVKIFDGGGSGKEITTVDRTIPNVGSKSYINSAAKGYDQYGGLMNGLSFAWSNTNTDPEINLVDGYVTIGSGAQEGSFSYTATCGGKSATVTVNLTKKIYTVTYTDNVANETVFSDVQLSVQSGGNAPAYPDGTPSRNGYTFDGWYTSTDGGATLSASAYDFDTPVTGNLTLYAKWTEKNAVSIIETARTYTWDSTPKSFTISGTPNTGFAVQYKVNGNWTDTAPSAVGTYDVKITRVEDDTYKAYEKEITGGLVIRAATPTADAPTAINNLVYDGEPHNLISSETSEHGYWEYSLDGAAYSTAIPTGVDATTYTVYCRFVPNEGYNGVDPVRLSVTISPMEVAEPTVVGSYTYTGSEQIVELDGVLDCMTVSGNKATHAGNYEVIIALDGNHKWNAESDGEIAWSIGAKTVIPTAALEYASIIYSGSERKPTVTLKDGDTEIPSGEYTVSYSNNVNVGTATVTITDKENGNYTFAEITKTFEITKDGVSPVLSMADYVYGGTPTVPSVSGNNVSGTVTVYYSTDSSRVDKLWEDISGTTLNVGTYYMKAHVAATDNYAEGVSPIITFKVTPSQYAAPSAPTANEFTVTVNEADRSKKLEYSMDDTYWSNVPTLIDGAFELKGLAESTQYTIYLRVKASADGNYQASDAVSTVWTTPARYSVAYHANLGTGTVPASVTQNSGRSVTVARGSGLKRTGYTFAGWNTAANGTGTDYAPGSTISTGATLYAKWTANSYTVKFKANGGSGTMADQSFTYDATQALTRNAFTRDGYHFAGWALSSGNTAIYMDGQTVKNLSDKGTVTLHAVWAENVYNIGADFFSKSSHSINAKLMRGDAQIGSAQSVPMSEAGATYTGHCDFTGVPKGVYNIVAEQDGQDGKVMTKLIIITDHNDTVEITMPPSEVNSVLEVSEDALPVVVGGLEDEAATKAEESKTVTITMTVEKQEEQQLPDNASEAEKATQEAIAEIKEKASGKAFEFMDIEVEKTVEEAGQAGVSEKLTETNKVMEIVIPFDLTGKMDIAVYRHHNGQTEKLAESTTKADGTFYIDAVNHLIHVFSRKFSTYAIGYTAPVVNPPSSGGDYAPTYAITVEDAENGDVKANRSYASSGTTVTITVTPEDGYVLKELSVVDSQNNKIEVTDKGDGTYTFKMPRRKVTVTASFVADGSFSACPKDNTCPIWPFTDAETTAWYHDGVHYCIENGLMAGYGDGIFKPNADTTRAMITVMLWRLNGSPVVNYLLDFEDVEEGKWYTEAIRWAKSEGIATGYGNGYFGTNDAVTREQMVTILWRYAQHKGYDVSVGENTNILSYDDAFDVAEYAIPAMQWACGSGMVQGMNDPDGEGMILAPASKGTRAQIATMIMRFCEEILK